jgi:hypothetical protein
MSTAIANLTERMPSPNLKREKIPARPNAQDIADGLGYNRDLIGAVQALRIDSAPTGRPGEPSPVV